MIFSYIIDFKFLIIMAVIDLTLAQEEKIEVEEPRLTGEARRANHARQGSSKHQAHVHYSNSYHVPPELLKRKGGLDSTTKRRLILSEKVLIGRPLRHLIVLAESARPNPNLDYTSLAVCEGSAFGLGLASNLTRAFNYFACPLQAHGVWLNFVDNEEPDEAGYCCGLAPNQTCCTKDTFYFLYGRPIAPSIVVISMSAASGLALLLLLAAVLVFAKLQCDRKSAFDSRSPKADDPVLRPLIINSASSGSVASVCEVNVQTDERSLAR